MGNVRSYAINPAKGGKCSSCVSCSCSPFAKPSDEFPAELPKPPTYDGDGTVDVGGGLLLQVRQLDLQLAANAAAHHTANYHQVEQGKGLVVRRGQSFSLGLQLARPYQNQHDVLCLVFTAKDAKQPSYAQMTLVSVPVAEQPPPSAADDTNDDQWTAHITQNNQSALTIQVRSPSAAIVGLWSLDVDSKLTNSSQVIRYTHPQPIYLLFNPWCAGDHVYLGDEDKRKEYVLNDVGLIWRGTHSRLRPTPWAYAQFEEDVLDCAIYILSHLGNFRVANHHDPVQVVRHLSAVANAADEDGVLVGRWGDNFSGGQAPTKWAGSQAILQQFYKTKKPVKYGQCWVFTGVLTTVCRSLGIPCRSVTNFSSAHDTHDSLTVDIFCDDDGKVLDKISLDSVWNFHVWNEVWMRRPDLEPGDYGGWQAIDSTPQEQSDGLFRCGPASVAAIKRGEVKKAFDAGFLFAEVNADEVYWRFRGNTQPLKLLSKEQEVIGKFISTKAVGSFEREDITDQYKYPERSEEERVVMLKALRQSRSLYSRYYLNDDFEDVQFNFILKDDIVIGESFKVILEMKNKSSEKEYEVQTTLRVATMLYNGSTKSPVKMQSYHSILKPNTENALTLEVAYDDYERLLEEQCAFHIAAMAKVQQTDFDYFAQDDFRLRMPDIVIEPIGELIQNQEFLCKAWFKNPLPKTIKKGEFSIEGPGLSQPVKIKMQNSVNSGEKCEVECKMVPKLTGEKTIVVKFSSKELKDVDGFKSVQVKAAKTNDTN